MFNKEFNFTTTGDSSTIISASTLYSKEQGYGFINEEVKQDNELLQLPELNNGFHSWYWYQGSDLTKISNDEYGAFVEKISEGSIPLCFKLDVPRSTNYFVTITITAIEDSEDFILFTGRRRFMIRKKLHKGEVFSKRYNVNVCDIIPRGKLTRHEDLTIDIAILGQDIRLQSVKVEENTSPTIFIAGDSTVTDQPACYPYQAEHCYSGWGQCLSSFITDELAISNHSHSGLTTESFRSEGHYDIVMDSIKEGDYCMFQFAHNDQKLAHLKAHEGYRNNLVNYINEIRDKGATPILVTPICRNSWKGIDGKYNDLLAEYANLCLELGKEMDIPVVDLHNRSYEFITKLGLEASKSYFYPGDFTHTNDYGAYLMGYFVACELEDYFEFVDLSYYSNWIAPTSISLPSAPEGLSHIKVETQDISVQYKDIDSSIYKEDIISLAKLGIISANEDEFRPQDRITRVEAVSMVIKLYGFFATNVYNDMFTDVIGHEWYAGNVECACSNGIFDMSLSSNKEFLPMKEVSYSEFLSYLSNGYSSRKGTLSNEANITKFPADTLLSREEAAHLILEFKLL